MRFVVAAAVAHYLYTTNIPYLYPPLLSSSPISYVHLAVMTTQLQALSGKRAGLHQGAHRRCDWREAPQLRRDH
jgi:hypothetical protein